MRIAIISDIHAHSSRAHGSVSSHIVVESIESKPITQNPIKALVALIEDLKLEADLLALPGDFCDKSDEQGFNYAWSKLNDIGNALKCKDVISTIGNHDVLRGKPDAFKIFDPYKSQFPSKTFNAVSESFWKKGFAFVDYEDLKLSVVIINSSFYHTNDKEVDNGKVDSDQITEIENILSKGPLRKHRVALFHHHPILHERVASSTFDLMVNGSELMEVLDKFTFSIAIHGHKHDPRLKYTNSGAGSTAVFASGSFSCMPGLMLPGAYNTFHILSLEESSTPNCENHGTIDTWNFVPTKGWITSNTNYLPAKCGFGCTLTPTELALKTYEILSSEPKNTHTGTFSPMTWSDFILKLPEVQYLIQSSFETYGRICKDSYNIQFQTALPQRPEMIFLSKTL